MARTAKTNLKIRNAGVELSSVFDTIDLNTGLLGADQGLGVVGFYSSVSPASKLLPTETPAADGSITIFTFPSASAQPTWIISDNVWMQATTKKGTVNWTWNAGAKQATMSVGPTDDIVGIP